MQRILFVEDNDMLRQFYGMMMPKNTGQWETALAANGEAALAVLAQSPFDVLITDFHMPGINGAELVRRCRTLYPQMSRIIISGIGNQKDVADALGETHQFLAKPFDVRTLKATLTRIHSLDKYLSDEKLRALVGRIKALPSFPAVYLEVMKLINAPATTIGDIAEAVAQDPSLTVKMFQVVNSAANGLHDPVHSPFEAVQRVGMSTVRSIALSAHVFEKYEKPPLKNFSTSRLWEHLMATAMLAKKIMELEGGSDADIEDAYTAGMLHDLGKLMLADSVPQEFQQAVQLSLSAGIPLHEAEQQVLAANHAGVAAYLLGLWGLSAPIVEAVALHHTPEKTDLLEPSPLTAVHAANALLTQEPADGLKKLNLDYLEKIGMAERVEDWRHLAAQLVAKLNPPMAQKKDALVAA